MHALIVVILFYLAKYIIRSSEFDHRPFQFVHPWKQNLCVTRPAFRIGINPAGSCVSELEPIKI